MIRKVLLALLLRKCSKKKLPENTASRSAVSLHMFTQVKLAFSKAASEGEAGFPSALSLPMLLILSLLGISVVSKYGEHKFFPRHLICLKEILRMTEVHPLD